MDYEKLYREALERAKKVNECKADDREPGTRLCEYIFPELAESEDEKIRKEIITHCRNTRCVTEEGAEKIAKWIAWLDKQGKKETNDKNKPKFKVKYAVGEYNVVDEKDIAGVTFYGIEDEPNHIDYVKADTCEIINGGYGIKEGGFSIPTKPAMFSKQKPTTLSEEDEKIRKTLIAFHKSTIDIDGIKGSNIVDWLEKQAPADEDKAVKGVRQGVALSIINYLDRNTLGMCLSGMERADLESGVVDSDWSKVYDYMKMKLEKQGESDKPLYIRFGDIPTNGKSNVYNGEIEIGIEEGVSVYPAFETNGDIVIGLSLPITRSTLHTQQALLEYESRPCYLVTGDYVGKGTDGEPLIKNVRIIKEIKPYRIKQEKENKP